MDTPPHPTPHFFIPDWPELPHVGALMTTRRGGISHAPWDGWNLGDHVGDDPKHVQYNRQSVQKIIGFDHSMVWLKQIHGTNALYRQPHQPDSLPYDAAWSNQKGLVCMVMVADCLPILLAHQQQPCVAAIHAGWRGLANGILEQTMTTIQQTLHDSDPSQWQAWLGPCIGFDHFEVGQEVYQAFGQTPQACWHRKSNGQYHANLAALARHRLAQMGITQCYGNLGSPAWCTFTQSAYYFSHRRDTPNLGQTGRMGACVWLK